MLTHLVVSAIRAQSELRVFPIGTATGIEVDNPNGRVTVRNSDKNDSREIRMRVSGSAEKGEVSTGFQKGLFSIKVGNSDGRTDLDIEVPEMAIVKVRTLDGQITLSGRYLRAEAISDTGTIYAETPFTRLNYKFIWTASFPRFLSDEKVAEMKEKSAGKHLIAGYSDSMTETGDKEEGPLRELELRTARGIILLNVPPSQVPNNLRPKQISDAAKGMIRGGDSVLRDAIRRAAPDLFGEYASTLGPRGTQPVLIETAATTPIVSKVKRITVQVTDVNNRAFGGLSRDDFTLTEGGVEREIIELKQSTAPFNLLLLMDVSGSVRDYVDFIRKAGRSFVRTVDPQDRVSIVIFNDDVKTLTGFTADKSALSESLDSFDAGGGTALYDAIGYGLAESLRPLKGERTAIVVLSDGDDNRSFLPFEALIGAIDESGALVYPMYVPSSLIASSGNYSGPDSLDPLRDRYLANNLSSTAQEEGNRLASLSGGVYYPITKLSDLQKAYDDIVLQLRTAYTITFRSGLIEEIGNRTSPRLRVSVKKNDAFVKLGPVTKAGSE